MSERKPQTRYIPLRVRFRPALEHQGEREQNGATGMGGMNGETGHVTQPLLTGTALSRVGEVDAERRARQIRELLRLSDLLRADLNLDDVLQQIAASIAACTGFRALAVNLLDESGKRLVPVAAAGISDEDRRALFEHAFPVEALFSLIRPQFRISQSFFIPHENMRLLADTLLSVKSAEAEPEKEVEPGCWHPEDNLVVPLYSLREQKLLGCLLLDDPEDGKVPTTESIEVVELFASKAAVAIDNANIFREREEERKALEDALAFLREDLALLCEGDLRRHVRSTHKKLQPVAEAINAMVDEISVIFRNMRMVSLAVDEHTHNVQKHSTQLVNDAEEQERQLREASGIIGRIAGQTPALSEQATLLCKAVTDAVDVTVKAQLTVDRAVEGMSTVREATMQSMRTMKTLGESGQEINETIVAMTDLTTQMHLLALNAAIEATRAGEQGQGFVVIAQEIRRLAQHCSEAARKVGTYIRTMQHEATTVSQSVEQSTQQVIVQTELVTQSSVALEAISAVTEQLTKLAQGVWELAESQAQGSQQAVSSLGKLSHTKSGITGHAQEMQQSMAHLVELTEALRSRMTAIHPRER